MKGYIFILAALMSHSSALADDYRDLCYNRAWKTENYKQVQPKSRRVRMPKGCTTFQCVAKSARKSRKVLQVYRTKRIPAAVHWGNLGWARDNVAIIHNRGQRTIALLYAMGVEPENYICFNDEPEIGASLHQDPQPEWCTLDNLLGDLEVQDRLATEMNCLRKHGESVLSFNEVVPLP